MKVSSIYSLPMTVEENCVFSDDCRYSIRTDSSDTTCEEQAKVIALALNNHDKLLRIVKEFDAYSRHEEGYVLSPFEAEVVDLLNSIEAI